MTKAIQISLLLSLLLAFGSFSIHKVKEHLERFSLQVAEIQLKQKQLDLLQEKARKLANQIEMLKAKQKEAAPLLATDELLSKLRLSQTLADKIEKEALEQTSRRRHLDQISLQLEELFRRGMAYYYRRMLKAQGHESRALKIELEEFKRLMNRYYHFREQISPTNGRRGDNHLLSFDGLVALNPLDGPDEIRENIDILADQRDKLHTLLGNIKNNLAEVEKIESLNEEMSEFLGEANFFQEQTFFLVAQKSSTQTKESSKKEQKDIAQPESGKSKTFGSAGNTESAGKEPSAGTSSGGQRGDAPVDDSASDSAAAEAGGGTSGSGAASEVGIAENDGAGSAEADNSSDNAADLQGAPGSGYSDNSYNAFPPEPGSDKTIDLESQKEDNAVGSWHTSTDLISLHLNEELKEKLEGYPEFEKMTLKEKR